MKLTDVPRILWQMAKQAITGNKGSMLSPGAAAPDFSVHDESGNRHDLVNYRGKKVILWFFPKADTPG